MFQPNIHLFHLKETYEAIQFKGDTSDLIGFIDAIRVRSDMVYISNRKIQLKINDYIVKNSMGDIKVYHPVEFEEKFKEIF